VASTSLVCQLSRQTFDLSLSFIIHSLCTLITNAISLTYLFVAMLSPAHQPHPFQTPRQQDFCDLLAMILSVLGHVSGQGSPLLFCSRLAPSLCTVTIVRVPMCFVPYVAIVHYVHRHNSESAAAKSRFAADVGRRYPGL
jgi:hypothetical protein